MEHFVDVIISHIPKASNEIANDLAQHASRYKLMVPNTNSIEGINGVMATMDQQPRASADWR